MGTGLRRLGAGIALAVGLAAARPAPGSDEALLAPLVRGARLEEMCDPGFPELAVDAERFYAARGWAPAWWEGGVPAPRALALLRQLTAASARGLEPDRYDGPRWADRLALPVAAGLAGARLDVALTVSAMRFLSDLRVGRVDPRNARFEIDVAPKRLDLARALADVAAAADVGAAVAAFEPPYPGYGRLLVALARARVAAAAGDGPLVPEVRREVKPGDAWGSLDTLASRLARLGDLPEADALAAGRATRYGPPLVDAVKRFQGRHGLLPDGRLGRRTVQLLNVPLAQRVRQVELTLERWRWAPSEFETPPIVVNVPEFRLRAYGARGEAELTMGVVVGRAYRSETPVFAGLLRSVIFRPFWNVPYSIGRKELLPRLLKEPGLLEKEGYEIVTPAGSVAATSLDETTVRSLRSGRLLLRQRPGPANALGRVKLSFPNTHDVYLHDTPARSVFSRARRDVSHGCIRVERPWELASWVLRGVPGWTPERVREAMDAPVTREVLLPRPVPVLIVYATAVAREDGSTVFLDDVYGLDRELEDALRARAASRTGG